MNEVNEADFNYHLRASRINWGKTIYTRFVVFYYNNEKVLIGMEVTSSDNITTYFVNSAANVR